MASALPLEPATQAALAAEGPLSIQPTKT